MKSESSIPFCRRIVEPTLPVARRKMPICTVGGCRRLCRREEIRRSREPADGLIEEARRNGARRFFFVDSRRRLFSLAPSRCFRSLPPCGGGSGRGVHESWPIQSPQTPSRRNARAGIPALPPRPHAVAQTLARRHRASQRQQNLPANRLAPIRPRIRPRPPLHRRRTGT